MITELATAIILLLTLTFIHTLTVFLYSLQSQSKPHRQPIAAQTDPQKPWQSVLRLEKHCTDPVEFDPLLWYRNNKQTENMVP